MDHYFTILGLVLGVIGLSLAVYYGSKKRKIGKLLGIIIMIFGIVLIILPFVILVPSVEISDPLDNTILTKDKYEIRTADNHQKLIFSSIKVKGRNLPPKKYLHVVTFIPGAEDCWINSNPLPSDIISESEKPINFITFGQINDNNKNYSLFLLLSDEKIKSGDIFKLNKLPDYIIISDVVNITVEK